MKTPPPTPQEAAKQWLDAIGVELAGVDETLVACIGRRTELARQVIAAKMLASAGSVPQIVRPDTERRRIRQVGDLAAQLGVERPLAETLEHILIGASIKAQAEVLATPPSVVPAADQLRKNLLTLAAKVASNYGATSAAHGSCPVTEAVEAFETEEITAAIQELDRPRTLLLDIGCANGRELYRHVLAFHRGFGCDVSPDMIRAAIDSKVTPASKPRRAREHQCTFSHVDVEKTGIPLQNGSVSFAIMNNGTGSDFFSLAKVLGEMSRVLRPGGRFFASFHNSTALMSRGAPLPWVSAMRASPDRERGTMRVRTADGHTHEIPGRAYSRAEVEEAMPPALSVVSALTFPHTLSLLPSGVMANNPGLLLGLIEVDRGLARSRHEGGAYLMVSGIKT